MAHLVLSLPVNHNTRATCSHQPKPRATSDPGWNMLNDGRLLASSKVFHVALNE